MFLYKLKNIISPMIFFPLMDYAAILYFFFANPITARAEEVNVSREERLKQCQQCHPAVYENWKAGPHSNAYKNLIEYKERLSSHPDEYSSMLVKPLQDGNISTCLTCHTPQNLFENYLPENMTEDYKKIMLGVVSAKESVNREARNNEFASGIDCLSCHVKGNQVLTKPGYKPSGDFSSMKNFCNPKPSNMFADDNMCFTCHSTEATYYANIREKNPHAEFTRCADCHISRDKQGHWDHYYYWYHDIVKGKLSPTIRGLFDAIEIKTIKDSKKFWLELNWPKRSMPHLIGLCPEIVFDIQIMDKNRKVIFETMGRTNRKTDFSQIPKDDTKIGHNADFRFEPETEGFVKKYPLPENAPEHGIIILDIRKKLQFFAVDDHLKSIYKREIQY